MSKSVLGLSLLFLAACKNGENGNGSDCDAGVQECVVPWDCSVGFTCASGCCVEFGCIPGSCDPGSFCDGDTRECTSVGEACLTAPNGCECHILNAAGGIEANGNPVITMAPGSDTTVEAVLAAIGGDPLPGATFELAVDAAALFSVSGSTLTATADSEGGTATLTATAGTYATCEASLVHLGAPSDNSVRFFVFDDRTGAPVQGAAVVIGKGPARADTEANGVAEIQMTPAAPFNVSVFAADHNYLSVVGIPAGTADVALPLSARPARRETGGFSGKVDFSDYEQRVLGGEDKTIKVGFVASSFNLSSLLNFDLDLLIGPIADPPEGCDSVDQDGLHPPGCYEIGLVGFPGLDPPVWAPLPGGFIFSLADSEIKASFDVVGAAGRRYAWSLGGQADVDDLPGSVISLLAELLSTEECTCDTDGSCTTTCECDNDCLDFGTLLNGVAPLLVRFASGVQGNLPLASVPFDTWESYIAVPYAEREGSFPLLDTGARGRLDIGEPLHQFTDFSVGALPNDPELPGRAMEGLIVLTGANTAGFGFVPLGVAAGLDCTTSSCLDREGAGANDYDGHVNGGIVCFEDPNPALNACPPGAPGGGAVGADHIGLFHATPHGGLQGAEPLTIGLALPITALLDDDQPLRATGRVVRGELGATSSSLMGDFPAFPEAEATQEAFAFKVNGSDADIQWVTVASGQDPVTGQTTRWNIYFPGGGGTFEAPDPPGTNPFDPNNNGVGDAEDKLINATHVTFEAPGVDLTDLVTNDGPNLTDIFDEVEGFTITNRDIPVSL